MKVLRFLLLLLAVGMGFVGAQAQIGYQIALLNTATGEARANETVTVTVSLSNNAGEEFYSETKSATTNDFGLLSLSIGNADTFKEVDLSKMPFFIEVSANGVMIGKSQMLSVPVAEVAKRIAPIDKSLIVGTWVPNSSSFGDSRYIFYDDGKVKHQSDYENITGEYLIEGNNIFIYSYGHDKGEAETFSHWSVKRFRFYDNKIIGEHSECHFVKQ